jgi:hypothetical protein
MKSPSILNEGSYRHTEFLKSLTLNNYEMQLLRLFLKIDHNQSETQIPDMRFEEKALKNKKVAVEF